MVVRTIKVYRSTYEKHPIFIFVIMGLTALLNYILIIDHSGVSFLNVSLGISVVFFFVNGRKSYPAIAGGLMIVHSIIRVAFLNEMIVLSLFIAVLLAAVIILQLELMFRIFNQFNLIAVVHKLTWQLIFKNVLLFVFVSLIGAYFNSLFFVGMNLSSLTFIYVFWYIFIANMFGLLLFSLVGVLGYTYDGDGLEIVSLRSLLIHLGLFIMFIGFTIALVTEVGLLVFMRDYYIMLLFFALIGTHTSYRAINFYILVFLIFSAFYIQTLPSGEHYASAFTLTAFLIGASFFAVLIKYFINRKRLQVDMIESKNTSLDSLISEVYTLLNFSGELIDKSEQENYEPYLLRLLDIALNLVGDFDAGYSYKEDDGVIRLLQVKNYTLDEVPFLYESHSLLDDSDEDFLVIQNIRNRLKKVYGKRYEVASELAYPVKRRIKIRFNYHKEQNYIIVIDKFGDKDPFSSTQIDYLSQFAKLMRSLFKRNRYLMRNADLKNEIILQFVRMLDLFDPYTKGHSEDVAFFTTTIAKAMDISDHQIDQLYWAGTLHDIGKIGVSNQVLNKAGKLTGEEYENVKHHSNYGYRVLVKSKSLEPIASMVKHHHEWWDGGGYPDGLKGNEIPLGALIISVADTIATMATDRTYRKRMTQAKIVAELKAYKGKQFAPDVVDIAVDLLEGGLLEAHYQRSF